MRMFSQRILAETPELKEQGVRMRFIGRRDRVARALLEQMEWAEAETAHNTRITLFIAFDYGGPGGDPRGGRAVHGRRRGGLPPAPVRARHARPRPRHPHRRASSA
jgi:hypothetical protein